MRLLIILATLTAFAPSLCAASPDFADFDRRARSGERLSVVFFGASLTWGANASKLVSRSEMPEARTVGRGGVAHRIPQDSRSINNEGDQGCRVFKTVFVRS